MASYVPIDDSSSFTGSLVTTSSSSTVLGPGAITGRFLKAIGELSLDLWVNVIIRRRLAAIKQTLEQSPSILRDPRGVDEWEQMSKMYADLRRLCRDSNKEYYSLSTQRAAANLIRDITLSTRSIHAPVYIEASPTNSQWEALLERVLFRGDLLPETQDTVISINRTEPGVVHQEGADALDEEDGIQFGITTEVNQSYEDEPRNQRTAIFRYKLFKSRRTKISEDTDTLNREGRGVKGIGRLPRRQDPKVLVLGAGEVGKTTVIKQINASWGCDTTYYREIITQSFFASMNLLLDKRPDDPAVQHLVRVERDRQFFAAPDSAEYFFDSADRILAADYIPTQEDIMRCRFPTTGIWTTTLSWNSLTWHITDVGGYRSQRKKWINCFENVTAVLFVVALSDYHKALYEDASVNRMGESLALFDSIVNSRWFTRARIILLFNKIDVFAQQLKHSPLNDWFPDYEGTTYDNACKYIEDQFLSLVQEQGRTVSTHYICAINAESISGAFNKIQGELSEQYEQQMDLV